MENVKAHREELAEKAYPHRITKYFHATNDSEMKRAIMYHGYLYVSIPVRTNDRLVNYVWTTDKNEELEGAHAIVIYGWNKTGWLAQNSWGVNWGNGGRFIIPYGFDFIKVWGTEDEYVETDDLESPYSSPIGKFFAKIFNAILNFLLKFKRG